MAVYGAASSGTEGVHGRPPGSSSARLGSGNEPVIYHGNGKEEMAEIFESRKGKEDHRKVGRVRIA